MVETVLILSILSVLSLAGIIVYYAYRIWKDNFAPGPHRRKNHDSC